MNLILIYIVLLISGLMAQSNQWKQKFIIAMNAKEGVSISVEIEQTQFDKKSIELGQIEIISKDNYLLDLPSETILASGNIIKTWNKSMNQLIIDQSIDGDLTIFDLLTGDFDDILLKEPKQVGENLSVNFNVQKMGYSGYIKTNKNGEPLEIKVSYGHNQFLILSVINYQKGDLKLIKKFNPINAEVIDLRE